MADKNVDKEALKAQKEAEKAAKKAKEERIKQSKPKKEGNVFTRAFASIKRFCKDFVGTAKKTVWPKGHQVFKNTGVVLAAILVIGLAVFAVDWALTQVFDLGKKAAISAGEHYAIVEETTAETTTAGQISAETTSESEETTAAEADETTAEGTDTTEAE